MNQSANQFMKKLNEEYEAYMEDLLKHDVQYAVSHSLETVIKERIIEFFSKSDYLAFQSGEWIDAMLEADNILNEIQKNLNYCGIYSGLLHLPDVIHGTGENLMKKEQGKNGF